MNNNKTKIILITIIVILIALIFALFQYPQNDNIKTDIDYTFTIGDFSYSHADLGDIGYLKAKVVSNCVYFEGNTFYAAASIYEYKYIKEKNNLKINISADPFSLMKHIETYGIQGKICNLEKGKYNLFFNKDLKESIRIR